MGGRIMTETKKKTKRKRLDIVKLNAVKRYIKDIQEIKVSDTAAKQLLSRYNNLIFQTIKISKKEAKKENRKTIMPRDMNFALDNTIGKKYLEWPEIVREMKRLNAIDLGKLVKELKQYVKEEKERKEI